MLRLASTSSVASLLSNLRSHDQISSYLLFVTFRPHGTRVAAVLEYMSSVVASLEPLHQPENGLKGDLENFFLVEHNSKKGKFHVRFKCRNGWIRVMLEVHIEPSGISFTSLSSEGAINHGLVPTGNGKPIQIYHGRRSVAKSKHEISVAATENVNKNEGTGQGEIIHFCDSDDEMPDSDDEPG